MPRVTSTFSLSRVLPLLLDKLGFGAHANAAVAHGALVDDKLFFDQR
ncbi:hypothetical protein HGG75_28875 [Ochrobactrum pseudogrignonense]|nr:hypothetical protein [Brucella pseudogrignonensis]